ncbi:hypothetical protein V8B97DRAFT_2003570 [Scleroderma yunnanense]
MDKGKGKAVNPPFGCEEDVTMPSDVHAFNDAEEEHRGWTRSHPAHREQHDHSQSWKCQKSMTSMPTLNMDDNMPVAMELAPTPAASTGICGHCMVAINSPPDEGGESDPPACPSCHHHTPSKTPTTLSAHPPTPDPSHKRHASSQSVTPSISRGSSSNHPKSHQQILDGVVIVTPSWLTTTSQPSTPGSVAANTGSTPPTTPSGTGSASGNNTAWIDALEAKVLALKKELVVKSHQLDDTWHKVSRALSSSTRVDGSHPNTPINDTSEVQQQPPTPASIEDAPTHTDGATVPDAPLVPATLAIIVSTLDDAVLIGSGEDNGANDMHVD